MDAKARTIKGGQESAQIKIEVKTLKIKASIESEQVKIDDKLQKLKAISNLSNQDPG
jgi:hypothetical protein